MPRCHVCRTVYERKRLTQKVCGDIDCAIEYSRREARRKLEKAGRKALREGRDRLKSRSDLAAEAQVAFNAFIRERDKGQPCISCGQSTGCKMNAGHYLSRGARPELRFHEFNAHIQCEKCNSYLSGNIGEYRKGLILKIGKERVEWLEGPHEPKHYTVDELKAIKARYREKLKELRDGKI